MRMHAAISDHRATVAGLRVHSLAAGETGQPVIFVHGGGLDAAALSWWPSLLAFAGEYRVVAPDLPGYGLSDTPAGMRL